jgi:signal peptidase II
MIRKPAICLGIACVVLALDQIAKVEVVAHMAPYPAHTRLLGGVLTLQLIRNPGAAFGLGASYTAIYALIAVGAIVFLLRTARRLRSTGWTIALGLLLGGAAGNLTDRIFRAPGPFQGYVVDWIKLIWFPPTFNLADTAITFGAILAALLSVQGVRIDRLRGSQPAATKEQIR